MEDKTRFIFPILATGIIVLVASAAVTLSNIGPRSDFVLRWLSAFLVGWPVAAVTGYFAMPRMRRLTDHVVALIEGKR